MYCSECGTKIDGMKFCPNCGHRAEENENEAGQPETILYENETVAGNAAADTVGNFYDPAAVAALRKKSKKKKWWIPAAGILLALVVVLVFILKPVKTMHFEFGGYDVAIPDAFVYNEAKSGDTYARFDDADVKGNTRIDIIDAGVCDVTQNGMMSDDIIHMVYSLYDVPWEEQPEEVEASEVDSIAGMYTVAGEIPAPGDEYGQWMVYASLDRNYELYYFVLMDASNDMVKDFKEAIYQTEKLN